MKKNTDDLFEELKKKNTDFSKYLSKNKDSFVDVNLKAFWNALYEKSEKTKSNIVNNAEISYIYFYEILQGKKVPTKDIIVRLILSMGLTLDDCQKALKTCSHAPLYPKIKRESCLIYAIEHGYSVHETQALLAEAGEEELR